ncbi:MAG: O-antigen translocase [Flavobacteriaceae bacterium]
MKKKEISYRHIVKTTSIFGGVQVFNIFVNIIRSKFVAVLLGPTGIGIAGLLSATVNMVIALTNFGLGTSAVKDISAAHGTGDNGRVSMVVTVFRRLIWITGLLGALVTMALSAWLSQLAFGNTEYTWAFIFLSFTLLLNQISTGQKVLLRGMRKIRDMAQAGMIGSVVGLITTVPLYYIYGIDGIVPGMIITSVSTLFVNWLFARRISIKSIKVTKIDLVNEGKGMLKLGFLMSLSGLLSLGASYIVRIFISNLGGVDQIGLYNAGFAIINTYVGMIFTSMSTDYYPRLAAVAYSNSESKTAINQQAEVALLIIAPIIMVFLVFINWVVIILYSTKFIPINDMILFAAIGMLFKAASWSISFILPSKGLSKMFFWNEVAYISYLLLLNIVGYYFFGLTGLGISFMITYIIYFIQVYMIARIKFNFSFTSVFYRIFFIQLILVATCLLVVKLLDPPFKYIFGSVLITVSWFHAYRELDARLDIKNIIKNYLKK